MLNIFKFLWYKQEHLQPQTMKSFFKQLQFMSFIIFSEIFKYFYRNNNSIKKTEQGAGFLLFFTMKNKAIYLAGSKTMQYYGWYM